MSASKMHIIVAWCEDAKIPVDGTGRVDLGIHPDLETVRIAKACTWLLDGESSDIAEAENFAIAQGGGRVFTYPRNASGEDLERNFNDAKTRILEPPQNDHP